MSSVLYSAVKTLLSLYQSFACFKSIKNEDTEDYPKWLKYWTVYGVFSLSELVLDLLLDFLPFYFLLKLLLLLLFVSPLTSGSEVVFQVVVRPLLSQRETFIEEQAERLLGHLQTNLARCFSSLLQQSSYKVTGQSSPERISKPITRRLSMDSLISEDDYYYQRNPDRQIESLDRSLDYYTSRNREDNYNYQYQEQIQYIPRPQVQHRSLQYNAEYEHYQDCDRRSRYNSHRNQDCSEEDYRTSTIPRWRRRSERSDMNYLDGGSDWSQYRGRWRSLYEGLEARDDHYYDSRRSERNYLERDRYRRSLERQRYSASTATVSQHARGRPVYEYYERNDDFI